MSVAAQAPVLSLQLNPVPHAAAELATARGDAVVDGRPPPAAGASAVVPDVGGAQARYP